MVVGIVATLSTVVALALAASHAPGDHPLPLLGFGCVLAFVTAASRIAPAMHLGLAAMSGFPIGAVIDLCRNGGHNLLPIEFALYAVYAGIGVLLAILGKRLRILLARR